MILLSYHSLQPQIRTYDQAQRLELLFKVAQITPRNPSLIVKPTSIMPSKQQARKIKQRVEQDAARQAQENLACTFNQLLLSEERDADTLNDTSPSESRELVLGGGGSKIATSSMNLAPSLISSIPLTAEDQKHFAAIQDALATIHSTTPLLQLQRLLPTGTPFVMERGVLGVPAAGVRRAIEHYKAAREREGQLNENQEATLRLAKRAQEDLEEMQGYQRRQGGITMVEEPLCVVQ